MLSLSYRGVELLPCRFRRIVPLCFLFGVLLIGLLSQPSLAGNREFDPSARVNTNLIDMRVTNYGSFAYDEGAGADLIYPNGTGRTVAFAGGIWLGTRVNGEVRVSAAEFCMPFAPGPILAPGEWADPEDESYRTYKIEPGDSPGEDPDYGDWPIQDGAPVGEDGWPRVLGQQTLWSVYNDLNPDYRDCGVSSNDPLGVEVRQTTFADYWYGTAERTVFIEWMILNKSLDALSDTYVSFWLDPDIGDAYDDVAGCDTLLSLGYSYNGDNDDPFYGTTPPAVGFVVVQGPVVPSPGDNAYVSGVWVPDYKNLPMTAYSKLIIPTEPTEPSQVYNLMQGLDRYGNVVIDPTTGLPTNYCLPGDPVSEEGWFDEDPYECRILVTSGPFEMAPGDSQTVAVALIVGHGPDRLASVTNLKQHAGEATDLFRTLIEAPQPTPTLVWSWYPEPRWLTGVNWGGRTFFGGIGFGDDLFGSTLEEWEYTDVLLRFDSSEATICARYDRNQSYAWVGTGLFRGSAYDVSDPSGPRRLNICFSEFGQVDAVWEPDTSGSGLREYLFIMDSDYNEGVDYDDLNHGLEADVQYFAWFRLREPYSFLETDPATLMITFASSMATDEWSPSQFEPNSNLTHVAAFPNPARGNVSLSFDLVRPSPVTISVLDASGRLVSRPVSNSVYDFGSHRLDWQRMPGPSGLSSGVYFWRVQAGNEVLCRRVVMVR